MKINFLAAVLLLPQILLAEAPEKLRVGVIQSLTGIAAQDGQTVTRAVRLAAKDIKEQTGREIELLIEDDQTSSKGAVSAFQKLVTQQPHAIVGATWDFTTNPLLPMALQKRIVLFTTSTFPEALELDKAGGYGFANAISARQEAAPFKRFLRPGKDKTVGIAYANNSWGETQRHAYAEIAREAGLRIVDEVKPADYDQNDWREFALRMKAKNPDLVLLLLNKNDVIVFLRRAREISLNARMFVSPHGYEIFHKPESKPLLEGACFSYPLEQMEKGQAFAARYEREFGEPSRMHADSSYDALFILQKAFALSVERGMELNEALRVTQHEGIVGEYSFEPQRSFSLGRSSLVCVEGGKLRIH